MLEAINDWQAGSKDKDVKANRLAAETSAHVETVFRECSQPCFRVLDLSKKFIFDLFKEGRLPESISAWTVDRSVAEALKGGIRRMKGFGVIIGRQPEPHEVVINLEKLYQSERFIRSFEAREAVRPLKYIRKWMGSQREVILRVESFDRDKDVCAWGGRTGTMEQLEETARSLGVPEDQIDILGEKMNAIGAKPGDPWWTSDTGARNIVMNTLEKAHARGLLED